MQYKHLSDLELHSQTQQAAQEEKSATLILLEYLTEVDERMLYAKRGYSTLWLYVHQELKYSEAQASERVSAMRLMRKAPEVKVALKQNELSLTSTAKIASFVRQEKSSASETLHLIEDCKNKSTREVERILLSKSTQPIASKPEMVRMVTPEITRIAFDADEEIMNLIQKIKEQNADPTVSVKEVIRQSLTEKVHQLEKRKTLIRKARPAQSPSLRAPEVTVKSANGLRRRFISKSVKIQVAGRAGHQCQYQDAITQKRCESKTALQYDHIHPYGKGGSNDARNLRLLCPAHNRLHAIACYGKGIINKMGISK